MAAVGGHMGTPASVPVHTFRAFEWQGSGWGLHAWSVGREEKQR